MQAFHFTDTDLQANREGHITSDQRRALRQEGILGEAERFIIFLMAIGVSVMFFAFLATYFSHFVSATVVFVVSVATLWWGLRQPSLLRATGADLEADLLLVTLGEPEVINQARSYRRDSIVVDPRYRVRIGKTVFMVTEEQLYTLHPEQTYRVYYVPNSKIILSLEVLLGECE